MLPPTCPSSRIVVDDSVHAHRVGVDDHGLVDGLAGGDGDLVLVEVQIQRGARRRAGHQCEDPQPQGDRPRETAGEGREDEEQQHGDTDQARRRGHEPEQFGYLVADQEEKIERHFVRSLQAEGIEPLETRRKP
jgi:hypothetical protein